MPTYISMLRGINVGGYKKVPMDRLRAMCEMLGFAQVRTFIQSGNVVFKAAKCNTSDLSAKIEKKILAEFGFPASVITRAPDELAQAIQNNPFVKESGVEPAKVHIAFLSKLPRAEAAKNLEALATQTEQVRHCGREVFLYYREGMGRAKLTMNIVEKSVVRKGHRAKLEYGEQASRYGGGHRSIGPFAVRRMTIRSSDDASKAQR